MDVSHSRQRPGWIVFRLFLLELLGVSGTSREFQGATGSYMELLGVTGSSRLQLWEELREQNSFKC